MTKSSNGINVGDIAIIKKDAYVLEESNGVFRFFPIARGSYDLGVEGNTEVDAYNNMLCLHEKNLDEYIRYVDNHDEDYIINIFTSLGGSNVSKRLERNAKISFIAHKFIYGLSVINIMILIGYNVAPYAYPLLILLNVFVVLLLIACLISIRYKLDLEQYRFITSTRPKNTYKYMNYIIKIKSYHDEGIW